MCRLIYLLISVISLTSLLSAQKIEDLRVSANNGDAQAQLELGLCFFRGVNVDQSDDSGMVWLKKAVEQEHTTAQAILGGWYMKGSRVSKDPIEGIRLIKASAEHGDSLGQFQLAISYMNGDGVDQDS